MFNVEGLELRDIAKRLNILGLVLIKRAGKSTECVEGAYLVKTAEEILKMVVDGNANDNS